MKKIAPPGRRGSVKKDAKLILESENADIPLEISESTSSKSSKVENKVEPTASPVVKIVPQIEEPILPPPPVPSVPIVKAPSPVSVPVSVVAPPPAPVHVAILPPPAPIPVSITPPPAPIPVALPPQIPVKVTVAPEPTPVPAPVQVIPPQVSVPKVEVIREPVQPPVINSEPEEDELSDIPLTDTTVKGLSEEEIRAIKLAEEKELLEKQRKADQLKKKRQSFLSDIDSFSLQFEQKTQVEESLVKDTSIKNQQLKSEIESHQLTVEGPKSTNESSVSVNNDANKPFVPKVFDVPMEKPVEKVVEKPVVVESSSNLKETIALSSVLFAASSVASNASSSSANDSTSLALNPPEPTPTLITPPNDELRVPTRIGNKNKAKDLTPDHSPVPVKTNTNSQSQSSKSTSAPVLLPNPVADPHISQNNTPATTVPAPRTAGIVIVDANEDEEEEGTGHLNSISNILTREERRTMTTEQKANWRAKQQDLYKRRKDFHGAVTYMFDGIFSWQMYGSAEAMDEYGNTYTEYLMRCQWGTTFDNLQPWIVAHRYREFDKLDQELKKQFPSLDKNMPKLPKKELFRSMENSVVTNRRTVLEEYMTKIVESMPTIMRSVLIDDFLHITERLSNIRTKLNAHQTVPLLSSNNPSNVIESYEYDINITTSAATRRPSSQPISANTFADPLLNNETISTPAPTPAPVVEKEEVPTLLWSIDAAEEIKVAHNSPPLDEDQMGWLEEKIKALGLALQVTPKPVRLLSFIFHLTFIHVFVLILRIPNIFAH